MILFIVGFYRAVRNLIKKLLSIFTPDEVVGSRLQEMFDLVVYKLLKRDLLEARELADLPPELRLVKLVMEAEKAFGGDTLEQKVDVLDTIALILGVEFDKEAHLSEIGSLP